MHVMLFTLIVIYAGTSKPNITLLNNHVRKAAAPKWHGFGEQLLMKTLTRTLDVIGENYQDDVKECCTQLFSYWLDSDNFHATWNTLFGTLKQTGYREVVATVKRNDSIKGK